MVWRRGLLWGAGGAALGAALGGGVAGLLRQPGTAPAPAPAPAPGVLTIISGQDLSRGGQRRRLLEEWNAQHPDKWARIIEVGGVADAHRSEMVARAQAGGGTVDIYNLDVTWIAEFAEAGYIQAIEAVNDGFLDQPWRSCQYRGRTWALPFNTDAGLLYYRPDLLPGPAPEQWTWEGLTAQVAEVLADPPDGVDAGYATQLADYEGLTVNAHEMIWWYDGEVVGASDWWQPDIQIDSGEAVAALCELAKVHSDRDPRLFLRESLQFDESATTRAFRDGKVIFMRNWPVAYRALEPEAGEGSGDEVALEIEFEVARLPGPSVLGGQNLAIAQDSPRPEAAQELIEFLTSAQSQQQLFLDGGLATTRRGVYDSQAIQRRYPYAAQLRSAVEEARLRPETPYYSQFSEVFRAGVREVMAGGADGCQLPDDLPDRLREAMRGVQT